MSWYERSGFCAGLIGACLFSASVSWAQVSASEDDIVMEKMTYTEESLLPATSNGAMKIPSSIYTESFSTGERYFPVILVETADFKALDSAFIARMFNEEGFKDNGVYGSVRDYYIASSAGLFKPTFDIYPVKLPKNFSEYNTYSKFVLPSIDSMVVRSDFQARANLYEKIIPFIILHPTSKEKAQEYNENFFNHKLDLKQVLGKVYTKNGYSFNDYAFVSQKAEEKPYATSTKDVAMLGAFIHEFSHVMGLSDVYSADSRGYATIGPLPYDVMALGLRNGNGGYPPTFSAFERESMGWLTPTEITDPDSVYVLQALSEMLAYAVSNPNQPNEYYLIEYRPAVGFDSKIKNSSYSSKQGKNGVFIWYIDYDSKVFNSNKTNDDVNHQRVEVRSVLSKNQEYFTDFSFVNNGGKAGIEGIFNFVFDGNDRVCFTLSRTKTLEKCPDVASSSSEAMSSSSSMSGFAPVSSSSSMELSSSSESISTLALSVTRNVQMQVAQGKLNTTVPMAGKKTLRFYDALGNAFKVVSFEESFVSVDISGWNRSIFVRLDVNGNLLLAKRVTLR